jgi:Zn-dependent oligopeptidase
MEMWLQNDGFVHRLVQLSQVENALDEETLQILRDELKSKKALEVINTIFLSELQFAVFDDFDPRGDETLVAMQARLAQQHLPKGNLPNSTDLSPLLAVFQEFSSEQNMSAYGPLWSEILSATVYEAFQKTDLRERAKVERLGRGIRNLFWRLSPDSLVANGAMNSTLQEWEMLCGIKLERISAGPLQRVYGFDRMEGDEEDNF